MAATPKHSAARKKHQELYCNGNFIKATIRSHLPHIAGSDFRIHSCGTAICHSDMGTEFPGLAMALLLWQEGYMPDLVSR